MTLITANIDDETMKIWKSIPSSKRSETIRDLLKTYAGKDSDKKNVQTGQEYGSVAEILAEPTKEAGYPVHKCQYCDRPATYKMFKDGEASYCCTEHWDKYKMYKDGKRSFDGWRQLKKGLNPGYY